MADYNHVYKDKCATEFMALKDCYLVSRELGKKGGHIGCANTGLEACEEAMSEVFE